MNTKKYIRIEKGLLPVILLAVSFMFSSCQEEEDPFVDRTVAPVLIVFDEVTGYLAGGALTSIPSVRKNMTPANYNDPVVLSLTLYELDKSGIMDHTVGIDSLPVPDVEIIFSKRNGTLPIETSSDESGKATITTTWQELGITNGADLVIDPKEISISVQLTWTLTYKGLPFVRYSQVEFYKPKS